MCCFLTPSRAADPDGVFICRCWRCLLGGGFLIDFRPQLIQCTAHEHAAQLIENLLAIQHGAFNRLIQAVASLRRVYRPAILAACIFLTFAACPGLKSRVPSLATMKSRYPNSAYLRIVGCVISESRASFEVVSVCSAI